MHSALQRQIKAPEATWFGCSSCASPVPTANQHSWHHVSWLSLPVITVTATVIISQTRSLPALPEKVLKERCVLCECVHQLVSVSGSSSKRFDTWRGGACSMNGNRSLPVACKVHIMALKWHARSRRTPRVHSAREC
eukprot:521582-Amphidinium_carterae.1